MNNLVATSMRFHSGDWPRFQRSAASSTGDPSTLFAVSGRHTRGSDGPPARFPESAGRPTFRKPIWAVPKP